MSRPGLYAAAGLLLLVLVGWHVHASSKSHRELNPLDRGLLSLTGPIQGGLTSVARALGDGLGHYLLLVGIAEENDQLRDALQSAQGAVGELHELRMENDRLRELAGLRERAPADTVGASVIGRGTSDRFRTLRIDRGEADGLAAGMPVVAATGAVGRVLRLTAHYSDILLLVDGLSAAGAHLEESRLHGVIEGDGSATLRLGFIRRRERHAVSVGELVVTSGEDGVFPEGIPIGYVVEASKPRTGLFLEVRVQPAVAIDRVEEVMVVRDPGVGPFSIPASSWPVPATLRADELRGLSDGHTEAGLP
jgi:rod shape-determining protein MreC